MPFYMMLCKTKSVQNYNLWCKTNHMFYSIIATTVRATTAASSTDGPIGATTAAFITDPASVGNGAAAFITDPPLAV